MMWCNQLTICYTYVSEFVTSNKFLHFVEHLTRLCKRNVMQNERHVFCTKCGTFTFHQFGNKILNNVDIKGCVPSTMVMLKLPCDINKVI